MSDILERLKGALTAEYTVERLIGQDGMAMCPGA
jgi:hypothetical protein